MDYTYDDYKSLFKVIANSGIHEETIHQIKSILDSDSGIHSLKVEQIELVIKAAKETLVD